MGPYSKNKNYQIREDTEECNEEKHHRSTMVHKDHTTMKRNKDNWRRNQQVDKKQEKSTTMMSKNQIQDEETKNGSTARTRRHKGQRAEARTYL